VFADVENGYLDLTGTWLFLVIACHKGVDLPVPGSPIPKILKIPGLGLHQHFSVRWVARLFSKQVRSARPVDVPKWC